MRPQASSSAMMLIHVSLLRCMREKGIEINNLTVRAPFQPVDATTESAMVHAVYALRGQLIDELPHTD